MSNRAPITTEDTAGSPCPLVAGSIVASATPGYYAINALSLSGAPWVLRAGDTMTGALSLPSMTLGSGTAITKIVVYTPSLTPASVAAGAPSEQTFAVAGLTTADTVTVNSPGAAVFSARVSAADTLAVTFMPPASGSYTPPSGTYRVLAHRS